MSKTKVVCTNTKVIGRKKTAPFIDATVVFLESTVLCTPREIERGLAGGGGLASVGRDLVRRSRVPEGSRASLQFDTNEAGLVVAFRVLDVSSAEFEWEEVAQAMAAASRQKPPMRVPPGWRGIAITLEVSCDLRSVDGAASRDLLDKVTHVPMLRVASARVVDVTPF